MSRIPDATIDEIRDRSNIVDLIGRFVSLKRAGRSYKGLCPFHEEKTPSFNVNLDRQIFHCFGCDAGGDVFEFLMRRESLTFPEAVRTLAQECGVEVPESGSQDRGLAERLCGALEVAHALYREALAAPIGAGARAYLERRGIDATEADRVEVGFAPDRWDAVACELARRRIAPEVGEQAGLLAARSTGGHYDRLRGRLTFPIRDARGRLLGFGGRVLGPEQEPKYLNTPETPLFRKREVLFGFPYALEGIRRAERVVVVEGYFDVLAMRRAGVDEAVATCGTALTADHARSLRRRTRELILVFDGDDAGRQAIERALEVLLAHDLRVRAAMLPAKDDPDTFLDREGADALRELVVTAPPALDMVIQRAVSRGCGTPWEKADAVAGVAPLVASVRDPVERGEFSRRLAFAAGAEPGHVEQAVRAAARGDREGVLAAVAAGPRRESPVERNLRTLARMLIDHPQHAGRLPRDDLPALIRIDALRELLAALIDAALETDGLNVAKLAERLDGEARRLLLALASDARVVEEAAAVRAIDDTVAWLRKHQRNEERQALRRRFEDREMDSSALLAVKQRELEARRAAQRPTRSAPP